MKERVQSKVTLKLTEREQRLLLDVLYHALDPTFPIGPAGSRAWEKETKERWLSDLYQKVGRLG